MLKYFQRRSIIKSLMIEPSPIIDPDKRIMLLWSAKAGCTFAIKWLFAQMELLAEAEAYHPWLHEYRRHVYYKSDQYKSGLRLFADDPGSFKTIKVVTDPYRRAVRSYIHSSIYGYEDTGLTHFLGRKLDKTHRYSFREFAKYLETIDLKSCDIHHMLQTSDAEFKGYVTIDNLVPLEESMNLFPRLEDGLGLKKIDLNAIRKSYHHKDKQNTAEFMGDSMELRTMKKSTVPVYTQFYDDELKNVILKLYEEDFTRYNYDKSLHLDG